MKLKEHFKQCFVGKYIKFYNYKHKDHEDLVYNLAIKQDSTYTQHLILCSVEYDEIIDIVHTTEEQHGEYGDLVCEETSIFLKLKSGKSICIEETFEIWDKIEIFTENELSKNT